MPRLPGISYAQLRAFNQRRKANCSARTTEQRSISGSIGLSLFHRTAQVSGMLASTCLFNSGGCSISIRKLCPAGAVWSKFFLAKARRARYSWSVNSVREIETALGRLPRRDRCEIARWLLEDLLEASTSPEGVSSNDGQTPPVPDYSARRHRIFGDKVLPNMV